MSLFNIFSSTVLPFFLIIAIGYILEKNIKFDTKTLSRIQFYAFLPALVFTKTSVSNLSGSQTISIALATGLIYLILTLVGEVTGRIQKMDAKTKGGYINSIVFYNCGNFALPLILFLFSDPIAVTILIVIIAVQNSLTMTVGVLNATKGSLTLSESIKKVIGLPFIYAMIAGFIWSKYSLPMPTPVFKALDLLGQGMIPAAILTMGIQLAKSGSGHASTQLVSSLIIRLIVSPLIAWGVCSLLNIHGMARSVSIIAAGAPTAVNTLIVAIEFNCGVELAAHTVFWSTILSILTITGLIYAHSIGVFL